LPHQQIKKNIDYYMVFFAEFIVSGFNDMGLGFILLLLDLAFVGYGGWIYFRTKETRKSFTISTLVLLTMISLSLFTSNRHIRHTFHLFPAIMIAPMIFVTEIYSRKFINGLVISLLLLISLHGFVRDPASPSRIDICFTGLDPNDYRLPRWIKKEIPQLLTGDAVLVNQVDPGHVNKADTEFVISEYMFNNRYKLLTDPGKRSKITANFKTVIVPANACADLGAVTTLAQNLKKQQKTLLLQKTVTSGVGCIQIYSIQ